MGPDQWLAGFLEAQCGQGCNAAKPPPSKSLYKESSFTPVTVVKGVGLPPTWPSWSTSPFGGYAHWLILGCVSMSGLGLVAHHNLMSWKWGVWSFKVKSRCFTKEVGQDARLLLRPLFVLCFDFHTVLWPLHLGSSYVQTCIKRVLHFETL